MIQQAGDNSFDLEQLTAPTRSITTTRSISISSIEPTECNEGHPRHLVPIVSADLSYGSPSQPHRSLDAAHCHLLGAPRCHRGSRACPASPASQCRADLARPWHRRTRHTQRRASPARPVRQDVRFERRDNFGAQHARELPDRAGADGRRCRRLARPAVERRAESHGLEGVAGGGPGREGPRGGADPATTSKGRPPMSAVSLMPSLCTPCAASGQDD